MATKSKGTKGKPAGTVVRRLQVPQGTREIVLTVTIGRPIKKGKKMAKSGIDADPGDGS